MSLTELKEKILALSKEERHDLMVWLNRQEANYGDIPGEAVDQLAAEVREHHAPPAQEILLREIKNRPEPVLREVLHYLKFLARQREEEAWADVLPTRQVEQEVLDILDGHEPTTPR